MLATVSSNLRLGFHLTRAELAKRNASSIGGLFWTFFTPTATIVTIWLALDYGLGMRATSGPGYGQALISGLAAWLFFSDAVNGGSQAIVGNPHFVKKVKFPVALLPAATVMAALVTHIVVLGLVVLLLAIQGTLPGMALLSLPAWVLLAFVIALSCALLASALTVVIPDVGAVLPSMIGLMFWLTPIVWPLEMVPEHARWIAMLNPMTLVVEGYRFALLGRSLPFDSLALAAIAFGILLLSAVAIALFARLRLIFADVL